MTTTDVDLIAEIVQHRRRMLDYRAEAEARMRSDTRRLAELLAATKDHPDPDVNPTSAARAIGVERSYTHNLIRQWEDGGLD